MQDTTHSVDYIEGLRATLAMMEEATHLLDVADDEQQLLAAFGQMILATSKIQQALRGIIMEVLTGGGQ